MKRYTHAWIALHAIDRLGKLADSVLKDAKDRAAKKRKIADNETNHNKKIGYCEKPMR